MPPVPDTPFADLPSADFNRADAPQPEGPASGDALAPALGVVAADAGRQGAESGAGDEVERLLIDAAGASGQRLDQFLAARLPGISRTRVQRWIALGAVRVDQLIRLPSLRLKGFEQIEVEPQPLDSDTAFQPDPVPLNIVYRDADVVVIDKPAGLVTHPAPGNWRGTLMNGLLHADPKAAKLPRAGIVHRLDRDTSGLLVCARSERAFASLTAQLEQRRMGRRYLAIAAGITAGQGTVDARIGRDERNRLRMAVVQAPAGKPARTHYHRLAEAADGSASAVLCRLESGRTHQIRVHMASIGHSLLGDSLYGGKALFGFGRQALHAWQLRFEHPADPARLCSFDAPIPADLRELAAALQIVLPETAPAD